MQLQNCSIGQIVKHVDFVGSAPPKIGWISGLALNTAGETILEVTWANPEENKYGKGCHPSNVNPL